MEGKREEEAGPGSPPSPLVLAADVAVSGSSETTPDEKKVLVQALKLSESLKRFSELEPEGTSHAISPAEAEELFGWPVRQAKTSEDLRVCVEKLAVCLREFDKFTGTAAHLSLPVEERLIDDPASVGDGDLELAVTRDLESAVGRSTLLCLRFNLQEQSYESFTTTLVAGLEGYWNAITVAHPLSGQSVDAILCLLGVRSEEALVRIMRAAQQADYSQDVLAPIRAFVRELQSLGTEGEALMSADHWIHPSHKPAQPRALESIAADVALLELHAIDIEVEGCVGPLAEGRGVELGDVLDVDDLEKMVHYGYQCKYAEKRLGQRRRLEEVWFMKDRGTFLGSYRPEGKTFIKSKRGESAKGMSGGGWYLDKDLKSGTVKILGVTSTDVPPENIVLSPAIFPGFFQRARLTGPRHP